MATHEATDPTTLYPTTSAKSLLDEDYQVSLRILLYRLFMLIPPLERQRDWQLMGSQVSRFPTLDVHTPRLLYHNIWPEHRRLGRHALPLNVQRSTSNVPSKLRQSRLITTYLD